MSSCWNQKNTHSTCHMFISLLPIVKWLNWTPQYRFWKVAVMTNSRLLSRHVGPAYLVRAGMKKEEAVSWLCFTQDAGWVDCVNFSDPWSSLPLWPAARSQCCWDDGVSGLCRDQPSIPETSAAFKRNRLTTKLPATTSPYSHCANWWKPEENSCCWTGWPECWQLISHMVILPPLK